MPFDRISRNMLHNKQNRVRIAKGKPKIEDLQEGVPVIREIYTDDPSANAPIAEYLTMYVKHKGKLYENVLTKVDNKRSVSASSITGSQETTITSDLLPEKDLEVSLGSTVKRFKDAYFGADTIYIGDLSLSQVGTGTAAKLQINSEDTTSNAGSQVRAHNITSGTTATTLGTASGVLTIEQTGADTEDDDNINIKVPDTKKVEFFVDGSAVGSVDSAGFKNAAGSGLLPLAGGTISGTLDIDDVIAIGNQSNINNNMVINLDHDQTFTAAGSLFQVACASTLNNHGSSSNNTFTALGFFPSVTVAADTSQITAIYGKLNITNSGGHTVDIATHILLRPQPTAATVNAQIYMEGDSDIYCEGDTTLKNKFAAIGGDWTFDATGGAHECLWTTSTSHGLVIGDIVQATTDGGGALSYRTGDYYYVVSVPSSTTVLLSVSLGGPVKTDTVDSTGNWAFEKKNELKIDGYDLKTSHHTSIAKMHMLTSTFDYAESAGTRVFIPLNGSLTDSTTISQEHCFIAPYSGYVDKVIARSNEACGSTEVSFWRVGNNTELPDTSLSPGHSVTVDMSADDTPYVFEFKTARRCTFSEGEIIAFSFDPTNDANDTMVTVVLKFNIDSPLD